jgi:DNA invertase Pin-like site-specific DNA recombinase
MSRPTFDRFLDRIRRGEADGLIVAKLDRFARSNKGALEAIEELESNGGVLISVAEQIDPTTASGRFMRNILLATAQWERDRIGEQWLVARTRAVERGIHVSHHVPPGYVRGPKTDNALTDRRLKPHRKHGTTITRAYEMAARGARDSEIADYLNERGLPITSLKSGEKTAYWWSSRIPRLLENRVYLGEASSGGGIVRKNAHPALIDEETWLLAQRGPTAQSVRRPNRNAKRPPNLLSGIVRCASCSFAMRSQPARKNSAGIYRCGTTSVHGRCTSPSSISMTRLEEYVLHMFCEYFNSQLTASASENNEERKRLARESADAERRYRSALTNVELRAKIGDADHDRLLGSLYDTWQENLRAVRKTPSDPAFSAAIPPDITITELVEQLYMEGQNERLRGLLQTGIEAIFVRPARSRARDLPVSERVKIIWRGTQDLALPMRGRRFEPRPYVW